MNINKKKYFFIKNFSSTVLNHIRKNVRENRSVKLIEPGHIGTHGVDHASVSRVPCT